MVDRLYSDISRGNLTPVNAGSPGSRRMKRFTIRYAGRHLDLDSGSGMVTIKDVARRAGVSLGTVSNVINRPGTVSHETRSRVLAAIDELGYVRSESARQLRMGHSRIVGLLVLDMGNPFFVDVARGAEHAARAAGLRVMVCNSNQDSREEAE